MNVLKKVYHILLELRKIRRSKIDYKNKNAQVHQYLKNRNVPELTDDEIQEIDSYWEQYGIKYKDYSWFQWYAGVTGKFNPRFIPNDVYAYIVWPYYNNEQFRFAWKDKNHFERFLPNVPFPQTVLKRVHGRFYDENGILCADDDIDKIVSMLTKEKEVIVKDAWDSGEGRGVKKYNIKTKDDVEILLEEWKSDNYLVQKVVKQHSFFSRFNESSVNVMRITSWHHDGKVEILCPVLRVGMPGFATDVCYIDNVEIARGIAINKDSGCLADTLMGLDGSKESLTDIVANSHEQVPCWAEILKIIKNNAPQLAHFDIVGWDFIVTDNNKPICIEYNIQRPGTILYQMCHGPFFEEHTDDVLSFMKDKRNQDKYIPRWLKIK